MSKPATMSAGNASSLNRGVAVNHNQGGGNALGGSPATQGLGRFSIRHISRRAYSSPAQRRQVFCMNQIGGIGSIGNGRSRLQASSADGVKDCIEGKHMSSTSEGEGAQTGGGAQTGEGALSPPDDS